MHARASLAEQNYSVLVNSAQVTLKNQNVRSQKLEVDLVQQNEVLYNHSFAIQVLSRKLSRALGQRTSDERGIIQERLKSLNDEFTQKKNLYDNLVVQLRISKEQSMRISRLYDSLAEKNTKVRHQLSEMDLLQANSKKQFVVTIDRKDGLLVDESIMRLEYRKMKSFLNTRTDEVLSLEIRHMHLQLSLEERSKQLEIERDVLRCLLKIQIAERQKLSMILREYAAKVSNLQSRYQVFSGLDNIQEGEVESMQAGALIQVTIRKEELRSLNESLVRQLAKMQCETAALEETLRLTFDCNHTNRNIVKSQGVTTDDAEIRKSFESEIAKKSAALQIILTEITSFHGFMLVLKKSFTLETCDLNVASECLSLAQVKLSAIKKEIDSQKTKIDRASTLLEKLRATLRKTFEDVPQVNLDVSVKNLRQQSQLMYDTLSDTCRNIYGDSQVFETFTAAKGLGSPSRASTVRSVASDSKQQKSNKSTSTSGRYNVMSPAIIPALTNLDRNTKSRFAVSQIPSSQQLRQTSATFLTGEMIVIAKKI